MKAQAVRAECSLLSLQRVLDSMMDDEISNVALAKRLGVTEAVVRRLLDLDHRSHIGQVEKALAELGKRLEIRIKAA